MSESCQQSPVNSYVVTNTENSNKSATQKEGISWSDRLVQRAANKGTRLAHKAAIRDAKRTSERKAIAPVQEFEMCALLPSAFTRRTVPRQPSFTLDDWAAGNAGWNLHTSYVNPIRMAGTEGTPT